MYATRSNNNDRKIEEVRITETTQSNSRNVGLIKCLLNNSGNTNYFQWVKLMTLNFQTSRCMEAIFSLRDDHGDLIDLKRLNSLDELKIHEENFDPYTQAMYNAHRIKYAETRAYTDEQKRRLDKEADQDYDDIFLKCSQIILSNLESGVQNLVLHVNPTKPWIIWRILQQRFRVSNVLYSDLLRSQLQTARIERKAGGVDLWWATVSQYRNEIRSAGQQFDDGSMREIILSAAERSGIIDRNFLQVPGINTNDQMLDVLRNAEQREQITVMKQGLSELAKPTEVTNVNVRNKKKGLQKSRACFRCGFEGHFIKDCKVNISSKSKDSKNFDDGNICRGWKIHGKCARKNCQFEHPGRDKNATPRRKTKQNTSDTEDGHETDFEISLVEGQEDGKICTVLYYLNYVKSIFSLIVLLFLCWIYAFMMKLGLQGYLVILCYDDWIFDYDKFDIFTCILSIVILLIVNRFVKLITIAKVEKWIFLVLLTTSIVAILSLSLLLTLDCMLAWVVYIALVKFVYRTKKLKCISVGIDCAREIKGKQNTSSSSIGFVSLLNMFYYCILYVSNFITSARCNQDVEVLNIDLVKGNNHFRAIWDSGAMAHVVNDIRLLSNVHEVDVTLSTFLDGKIQRVSVKKAGELRLRTDNGLRLTLKDVYYVSGARRNIISDSVLNKENINVVRQNGVAVFTYMNDILFKFKMIGNLYQAILKIDNDDSNHVVDSQVREIEEIEEIPTRTAKEWHIALNHRHVLALKALVKDGLIAVSDPENLDKQCNKYCEICMRVKSNSIPFMYHPKSYNPGDVIVTDLIDMGTKYGNRSGKRYVCTFVDVATHYSYIVLLSTKSAVDVLDAFREFHAWFTNQTGCTVKALQSDNGGEFVNEKMSEYLKQNGIQARVSEPYRHQMNGLAERHNQKLEVETNLLLRQCGIDSSYWETAIIIANKLLNNMPMGKPPKIPIVSLLKSEPDFSNYYAAGTSAVWCPPKELRGGKLNDRCMKCTILGPSYHGANYIVLEDTGEVIVSKQIRILANNEEGSARSVPTRSRNMANADAIDVKTPTEQRDGNRVSFRDGYDIVDDSCREGKANNTSATPMSNTSDTTDSDSDLLEVDEHATPIGWTSRRSANGSTRRSTSILFHCTDNKKRFLSTSDAFKRASYRELPRKHELPFVSGKLNGNIQMIEALPQRVYDLHEANAVEVCALDLQLTSDNVPSKFDDIARLPLKEQDEWVEATRKELETVFEYTRPKVVKRETVPKGARILPTKIIYKEKENKKKKARLVANGSRQSKNESLYAHVPLLSTIRLFFWLVVSLNLRVQKFDVEAAFLHAKLDTSVYVNIPEGIQVYDSALYALKNDEYVLKLDRSLYGLKQAPAAWNNLITQLIEDCDYKRSQCDPCLFFRKDANGKIVSMVLLYVDDILVAGDSPDFAKFKKIVGNKVKLKSLGEVKNFLGFEVFWHGTRRSVDLSLTKVIQAMMSDLANDLKLINLSKLSKRVKLKGRAGGGGESGDMFNIYKCKYSTPLTKLCLRLKRGTTVSDEEKIIDDIFMKYIGKINYINRLVRPDISYAFSKLSRLSKFHGHDKLVPLIQIVSYLYETADLKFRIRGSELDCVSLKLFADASYAGDRETRKSHTGFLIYVGNQLISWSSRLQRCVTLSPCECEYVAYSTCVRDSVCIVNILNELIDTVDIMRLYADNQAALHLMTGDSMHAKTRHIDVHYHFARQYVTAGLLQPIWIETDKQLADSMTKLIPGSLVPFDEFCKMVSLV